MAPDSRPDHCQLCHDEWPADLMNREWGRAYCPNCWDALQGWIADEAVICARDRAVELANAPTPTPSTLTPGGDKT